MQNEVKLLKTGDALIVMSTMTLIYALVVYPFDLVVVSALGLTNGWIASGVVAALISALVAGVVFAWQIQEYKKEAIFKITVLWALLWYVAGLILESFSTFGTYATQSYEGQYGATLSAYQWELWQGMVGDSIYLELVVVAVVTAVIGLYVGSMLRKPKKARTKMELAIF